MNSLTKYEQYETAILPFPAGSPVAAARYQRRR
jgi:hypothetical protein